jgi:hypothetical protein
MAQRVQIDCVNKTDRTDPHERIANVGGPDSDGTRWKLAEDAAIAGIESGQWAFYVEQPAGQVVDVVIATRLGRKYLKTTADGERPDNLLSLPECQ